MDKAECWRVIEICVRVLRRRATPADLDWLMDDRERAEAFDATMLAYAQQHGQPLPR